MSLSRKLFSLPTRYLSYGVRYTAYGKPLEVLRREKLEAPAAPGPKDVSLKILAAPINPADINMVEGVYGIKANFPQIAGNEGVGVVTETGSQVSSLKVGDWVIPHGAGFGTWRETAVVNESAVIKVANDIPKAYAATLGVNPSTAYRLLSDFGNLQPGDYVIQNGANSMVGYAIVQIANLMGIKTINIIRNDRPDKEVLFRLLDNLGGHVAVTDDYVKEPHFKEAMAELGPKLKVAFNCVGGDGLTYISRVMPPGSTIVTYGGMSKKPIAIPQEVLNYKQLNLRGFWMSEWVKNHSKEERSLMLEDLAGWVRQNKLSLFMELHDFDDFEYALERSLLPYMFRKVVLNMDYPDRLKEHDTLEERDPDAYKKFDEEYSPFEITDSWAEKHGKFDEEGEHDGEDEEETK